MTSSIIMIGAGAVGSVLAVRLRQSGQRVMLAARTPVPEASRLISITAAGETESERLAWVALDARSAVPGATVCVCVKAFDTATVARAATHLLRAAGMIVSAQNGTGNLERLAAVSDRPIVLAPPGFGAAREDDGTVCLHGASTTYCAPYRPADEPAARTWSEWLRAAGLPAAYHGDYRTVLWSKLIVNAVINPLTAIYKVSNGEISERPDLRARAVALVHEAAAVALCERAALPAADELVRQVMDICEATRTNRSSMLADVLAGRPTEIEEITGAIIALARRHGLSTPHHDALAARLRNGP